MSFFKDEEDGELTTEEELAPKSNLAVKIIKITFKVLFWCFILFVNALILWRVFSSGDPKDLKTVTGNEALKNAYEAYLADTSEDKAPFAIYHKEQEIITQDDPDEENGILGNYGYFSLSNTVIFPSAHQVQTLFRYNNSTLSHLQEDYDLPETPDRKTIWYDVTLRVVYDATPSNPDDDVTKTVRYNPTSVKTGWKQLYTYERLCFEDIEDWDNIISMTIDIYYINDVEYNALPYGDLCIFKLGNTEAKYKLSKADIAAIKSGGTK